MIRPSLFRRLGKNKIAAILLLGVVLWVWGKLYGCGGQQAVETLTWVLANQKVVVDPGHGGIDQGAVGSEGTVEAEVNLAISSHLAWLLERGGAKVFMTREGEGVYEGESGDDLLERIKLVQRVGADLFVSIHCNAFDSYERGAQTFYDADSMEGKRLAETIQKKIRDLLANTERVPLSIDAFVLRNLEIPAVIVEVGFLSNTQEERLLADPQYQESMAWAIYAGIVDYFAFDKEGGVE